MPRPATFSYLPLLALIGAAPSGYAPRETFAPFDMGQAVNAYRGADGLPGPGYWQNRADYAIHATLDPAAHAIAATVTIGYTNNGPTALDVLWLQLDQNIYKPDSRGRLTGGGSRGVGGSTDGMVLDSAGIAVGGGAAVSVAPLVSDTRAQLKLPTPLAHGARAVVTIRYHYTVPAAPWGGRTSWGSTKSGAEVYDVAQWYPRLAVYDDIRGWDTAPYLGQEFYLEYGDFDYWVTLPAGMTMAGSGALQNPAEVLTATERRRLAQAAASDATVTVRGPSDLAATPASGTRTWHFRMTNTRDVAWSASSDFIWDAALIRLPGGGTSMAMSYYPPESVGAGKWGRSTEYVKDTVENMSRRWYPYPWPAAINVAGPSSGMEYPGIVFDAPEDAGKTLFWITAHEIGHDWFPMVVGFDERRHAWMDEGFNTFIDTYESEDFNHGEYAPKRDSEYAPGGGDPVDEILALLADPDAPPILSRADTVTEKYRHPVTYFKSALGLRLLREEILGPERFDPAFRRFIAAWAYRHPKPADFFRAMESEAGEDLSWWWRGWYQNNWQMDLAVAGIESGADGATAVRVESRDRLVMPATLRVGYADGHHVDMRLPAETWIRQSSVAIGVPAGRVVRAELDPDHRLPDRDRSDNAASAQ
ncbi:M1 family metallopeptidase [Sphingomonas bacterium]|uniref:M1 family metallopeptidase n=1 Tax=Sphingomonas bacterium TaxID=1895847 RepID=UPI0015763A0D|nr:M1 family metallopeptidase [Sphingomonas bacterium]